MWSRALERVRVVKRARAARARAQIFEKARVSARKRGARKSCAFFSWARGARARPNLKMWNSKNIFTAIIDELIHVMFNVTVMGVCPSSLKSLKFCNRFLPILRLRSSSHTSFRHKLSLDFTARDIEQKSNPNLHTQKNFVIFDIVFVIFVDHSFVERARARSARAPKISSAFLNLGARSARDF